MKRKILLVLALMGLMSAGTVDAQTSGTCGDNLTWTLTGAETDLTLTISGTGDMYNYRTNAPWRSRANMTNIKTLVLHNGITSIGNFAFMQCSGITSVTIPNSVTAIGDGAFVFSSGFTSVTIPNSVTTIGKSAFGGCLGLTSVTIPNSVMAIGREAFSMCRNITDIYVSWTTVPLEIKGFAFIKVFDSFANKNVTLHIPQGTLAEYQSERNLRRFNLVEDATDTE